jgi:hypothetical protein
VNLTSAARRTQLIKRLVASGITDLSEKALLALDHVSARVHGPPPPPSRGHRRTGQARGRCGGDARPSGRTCARTCSRRCGEAGGGERRAIALITPRSSRGCRPPVSLAIKGPSSGGNWHLVELVLRLFPPSAVYALSAMSERALAYSTEPIAHRMSYSTRLPALAATLPLSYAVMLSEEARAIRDLKSRKRRRGCGRASSSARGRRV